MAIVAYHVVEHDGGWAYTVDGVFSETFPTHEAAVKAAKRAAAEQRTPGASEEIEYETPAGKWRVEHAEGADRPATEVIDDKD
jgi:hypothetical protein